MYGGLEFILQVCSLQRVTDGKVKVGCDNEKALFLSSKILQRVRQQRKDADILRAIRKVWTSITLTLELNHLRGNQDERIPAQLLERPSHINTECNVLAKLLAR